MDPKRLSINAALQIGSQLLPLVAAAAALPIIHSNLSPPTFGVFTIALSVLGLFALLDLGVGRSAVRSMAYAINDGQSEQVGAIARRASVILLVFSTVAACVFVLSVPWISRRWAYGESGDNRELEHVLYILAFSLPIFGLTSALRSVMEAHERFPEISLIQSILGIATYAIPLFASFVTQDMRFVVAPMIICRFIGLIVFGLYTRSIWFSRAGDVALSTERAQDFLRFSFWLVLSNFAGAIILYADRAVMLRLVPTALIPHYNVPLEILGRLSILVSGAATALFPAMAKVASNNHQVDRTCVVILLLFAGFAGPAAVTVSILTPDVLRAWLGPEFELHSTQVVRVLLIGVVFQSLNVIAMIALNARGFAKSMTVMYVLEAPFYILAMWLVGKTYGLVGVAAVWSLRSAIEFLCYAVFLDIARSGRDVRILRLATALSSASVLPLLLISVEEKTLGLAIAMSLVLVAVMVQTGRAVVRAT